MGTKFVLSQLIFLTFSGMSQLHGVSKIINILTLRS